jgi:NADPH-dependent glutamate synthase beta subunit-like oxidoreductase
VVGGGNSAIDAARVSRRLGADVTIFYRRTRKEMPAIEHEVVGAEEEGVHFEFLSTPVKIITDGKKATGAIFSRMKLGEPDASGRARPIPIPGSEYDVSADTIIASISQQPDFKGLEQLRNAQGWITVDEKFQTALAGVFAGGDVTNQLGLVTEAVGLGRKAAENIDAYLRGTQLPKLEPQTVVKAETMKLEFYKSLPRNEKKMVDAKQRVNNFDAISIPFTQSQVIDETGRCMSCGLCFGCDVCFSYCQDNAVKRSPEGADLKYFFNLEYCTGCKKCSEECPCNFIEMA